MNRFSSGREAKEYLVSQIVDQAQRDGMSLSEVERKMLYFAETDWTLPDIMDVNDEFDQEYDQQEYEKKIARIIKRAFRPLRKENLTELDSWRNAVRKLNTEDHYISVMFNQAGITLRPSGDRLKLWGTAVAIVAAIIYMAFLSAKYNFDLEKYLPSKDILRFVIWITFAGLTVVYVALRFLLGKRRMDGLFEKLMERFFGPSRRDKQEKREKNA